MSTEKIDYSGLGSNAPPGTHYGHTNYYGYQQSSSSTQPFGGPPTGNAFDNHASSESGPGSAASDSDSNQPYQQNQFQNQYDQYQTQIPQYSTPGYGPESNYGNNYGQYGGQQGMANPNVDAVNRLRAKLGDRFHEVEELSYGIMKRSAFGFLFGTGSMYFLTSPKYTPPNAPFNLSEVAKKLSKSPLKRSALCVASGVMASYSFGCWYLFGKQDIVKEMMEVRTEIENEGKRGRYGQFGAPQFGVPGPASGSVPGGPGGQYYGPPGGLSGYSSSSGGPYGTGGPIMPNLGAVDANTINSNANLLHAGGGGVGNGGLGGGGGSAFGKF